MKFLFVEIIFPLLVLLFLRSLLRSIFAGFRSAAVTHNPTRPAASSSPGWRELKKDPVCGTCVSTVGSVSQKVNGQVVYFCSTECRDKYRAACGIGEKN
jgi:YHS domain-containing protein